VRARFPRRSTYCRAPLLRGHYALLTHLGPSDSRSPSAASLGSLHGLPWSADFAMGRGGTHQLTSHAFVAVLPLRPRRRVPSKPRGGRPCCRRPRRVGSAPGSASVEATPVRLLTSRPGNSLAAPKAASSIGFSSPGFPPCCHPRVEADEAHAVEGGSQLIRRVRGAR